MKGNLSLKYEASASYYLVSLSLGIVFWTTAGEFDVPSTIDYYVP